MSEKAPERKRETSPVNELRDRISRWLDGLLPQPAPIPVPVRVRARR